MAINQAYLFLIFSMNGLIIGLIFDFFRILRKSFKTNNIITYIEDITFWILTGISIIVFMYNFSDGNLRFYMLLGLILGFLIYILTISKYIINFFVYIIEIAKKLTIYLFKILSIPINFIIKIYTFVYKKISKLINLNKIRQKK